MSKRWLSLVLFVAALGCARSPEATFYALFPQEGTVLASPPLRIEVRRPGLPAHLDRPQIVTRTDPQHLEFSPGSRWGAPLDDMIATTLAESLALRLPSAQVFTEQGAISSHPDVLVELEVQRFELNGSRVELHAQAALHWPKKDPGSTMQRYVLSLPAAGGDASQLVTRLSDLLAKLADALARGIAAGPPLPRMNASTAAGQPEP